MSELFSQASLDFLWGIALHNDRTWFQEHRADYLSEVDAPLRTLAFQTHRAMTEDYPDEQFNVHVSRIYRDARRLHGRGPYKSCLWFTLRRAEDPEVDLPAYYFEIAPDYFAYGLGYYAARPATMARFRARIDRNPAPMARLARLLAQQSDFVLEGPRYARPKGDPGQLLEPWYNRRSISVSRTCDPGGLLFQPQLADTLKEGFDFLMPLYRYLVTLPADPEP